MCHLADVVRRGHLKGVSGQSGRLRLELLHPRNQDLLLPLALRLGETHAVELHARQADDRGHLIFWNALELLKRDHIRICSS